MLYGVCLNRTIELIISIWAILKTGAIYMPMYVGYPLDRLDYMLENSNAKLLITNSTMSNSLKFNNKLIINHFSDIFETEKLNIVPNILPTDNAYIIYTSGSTGKPKGVQISHRNLINFVYNFNKFYNNISTSDIFISSTNISFDVSIWELFMPILYGAKLVLNTEELLNNIIDYCTNIINNEITALYIPPNILNEVYEVLKGSNNIKINKLLVGVEPITKETLNKYFDLNNDMIIVNAYGPTETTICATAINYQKDLQDTNSFVSIGHPLFNNNIYILNEQMHHQPVGVVGELYITGDGVGNGYINNSVQNEKHFIRVNNEILYKTGDLAKWNKDGTICFVGRNDNQVKISGYRIELNEISSVLMSYPHINKAHTIIYQSNNKPHIVSYFTSDNTVIIKDLKSYLQSQLAFYMIPKTLIQIDTFPVTANGKINIKLLPIPAFESDKPFVEPRNIFEKKLAKIWCDLLGLKKISIDDNLFDLGCDSLIAIKFQLEASKENFTITYGDIFNNPTIRMLSENKINVDDTKFETIKKYNYNNINKLLEKNKSNNLNNLSHTKNNTILLLGSTGFLGAHILDAYFSMYPDANIYCIIRKKSLTDSKDRLFKTLNYYFGNKYDKYFDESKIVVLEGDITQKNFGLPIKTLNELMDKVNIVINSAALVKHYGSHDTFSKINIEGSEHIVNICKNYIKKLYHISTLSVSGFGLPNIENSTDSNRIIFDETCFFVNQSLNNIYLYTKFEAERYILNEINNGLDATILRIGNLTNRFSDGLFQINVSENGFVNKLKSIISLGVLQESFLKHALELTPVDLCAKAIIDIINCNHNFSVLHLFNTNLINIKDILNYINTCGYNITCVSNEIFATYVTKYLNDNKLKNSISGIITDINKNKLLDYNSNIIINADITNTFLNKLGFYWPILDIEYFKKYFNFFKTINYFDKEDLT